MTKDRYKKIGLAILALAQLCICIAALLVPQVIVGDMTREDAEDFMEGLPERDIPNPNQIVHASIGFLWSKINGETDDSNREGMVGIFAFTLLSAMSSLFTLFYAIQLIFHKDDEGCCKKGCLWLSDQLRQLAKSNYSSGVSSIAAAAMTGLIAEDFEQAGTGANLHLQIGASILSFFIHLVKTNIEERPRGNEDN